MFISLFSSPSIQMCKERLTSNHSSALWCTIDIHTLHRIVTLHDAFASSVVSITTRLAIIREYHQAVVFVPVHLTGSVRRVVRYQCWITVGIIRVMVVTNLCWRTETS